MKRRVKGTGTIVKMGGCYYGRIVRHGKVKVVKLSTNQRESEALWKRWLELNPPSLMKNLAKHPVNEAWGRLGDRYVARGTEKSVLAYYRRHFETFRDWALAHDRQYLEDVTATDIVHYIEEATKGKSNCLKRNHLYMIRGLFETNVPDIPNPVREVKLSHEVTIPREPFTNDELLKIMEKAQGQKEFGSQYKVLIETALYTGLRLKDCVNLSVKDVLDDVIMIVPRKTQKRKIIVRVPLHPKLRESLQSLGVTEGHYFPDLLALYEKGLLNGRLKRIFSVIGNPSTTMAGRTRQVPLKTFHALRATFITRLAESGVSLPIMESLAGHINPQQTIHYTHPDEDVKKAAISTLPDFATGTESGTKFISPEIQTIIEQCKNTLEEVIGKHLGKTIEVDVRPNWRMKGEGGWRELKQLEDGIDELRMAKRDLMSSERPRKDVELTNLNAGIAKLGDKLKKTMEDGGSL